jgi:hypothetical protein
MLSIVSVPGDDAFRLNRPISIFEDTPQKVPGVVPSIEVEPTHAHIKANQMKKKETLLFEKELLFLIQRV